ncbi:hypothetical protein GCM10020256_52310 [Streptomyces thermocoprophilus]
MDEGAAHAGDLGERAGQQTALEDGADGGLPGVLAGGADGEGDAPAEVLHEAGDLVGEPCHSGPPDDERAEGPASGDEPVGEGGPMGSGTAGSGLGSGCDAEDVGDVRDTRVARGTGRA